MSNFDKVLHVVGMAAAATVATGGLGLPAWAVAICGIVAYAAGASAAQPATIASLLKKDVK